MQILFRKLITCGLILCAGQYSIAQCGYTLVWEDDFSGTTLDLDNWDYQLGGGGWGNNELQTYTSTNAIVSNGTLQIVAEEATPSNYTSSRIRSLGLKDIKYGKMEASIKLPEGQGIWPAFWMMPSCAVYGSWPASGEIDIMEYLGHQTNKCYATCHFGNTPSDKDQIGTSYTLPTGDFTDGFHLFSVEWSENNIKWLIDDILILEVNGPDVAPYLWPFNEEFHFILNVAVGGNWPGSPDGTTLFPQVMEVDYVKAYQFVEDITIEGPTFISPNSTGQTYTAPLVTGATYAWSIPECATLVAGQGTNSISVDWATDSGEIDLILGLPCQAIYRSLAVEIANNMLSNGAFEKGKKNWSTNFSNGGWGSFYLENTDQYSGVQSGCLQVNGLGNNFWDVQINHQPVEVLQGEVYTLSFYGKADANNRHMRVDFRNTDGNVSTDNVHFYLTDAWAAYSYQYTPSSTIASLALDFNHGYELGTFCYDEVKFEIVGPTIGDCTTNYCVENLVLQNSQIEDATYHAGNSLISHSLITDNAIILFKAGQEICLEAGFEVDENTEFTVQIEDCASE